MFNKNLSSCWNFWFVSGICILQKGLLRKYISRNESCHLKYCYKLWGGRMFYQNINHVLEMNHVNIMILEIIVFSCPEQLNR